MATKNDKKDPESVEAQEAPDAPEPSAAPEPEPAPEPQETPDIFAEMREIPVGATGPTVVRLQRALGVAETGVVDVRTTNAVLAAQRAAGAQETGRIDVPTRRMLKV